MENQTLTELYVGKQGEYENECFLKVSETIVLGQIRVFDSLWASPKPNWFGTTFFKLG